MDPPDIRSLALYSSAGLLFAYWVNKALKAWRENPSSLPYPPGPRPLPLLGNIRQFPSSFPWLTYQEWGRQYGPIMHVKAFSDHIVIINSAKIADDLLEKRSHVYSDRPVIPMLALMGWDFNLGFMRYGDKWRAYRRMMHQYFRREAALTYRPTHLNKIHDMLRGLLSSPNEFRAHIRTVAAAIILSTVYGYDIEPMNDSFVMLAENAVQKLGESVFPGAVAVNMFPWLRHLPGWLPGCGFQQFCAGTKGSGRSVRLADLIQYFTHALNTQLEGNDSRSVVAKIIQTGQRDIEMVQAVTGLAYAGNLLTLSWMTLTWSRQLTVSAISTFVLAMATYPDIQRKAQAEIDGVVGSQRLPEFSDKDKLPYIEAIYREVLRWKPVAPLSVSHATTENDIYDGYFIPKGATVVANIWAMCYDESIYPEPEKFKPERFLDADGQLTNNPMDVLAYGHGRRVCAGRYMAEETVWAAIVSILSTFDVAKAKDASGKEVDIPGGFSDGLIVHPEPFECSITPRSEIARGLIQETAYKAYDH
ncbi:cytochrome P450 [Mycena amicta]|nr:cytochrome P450 [Mycena amicta]